MTSAAATLRRSLLEMCAEQWAILGVAVPRPEGELRWAIDLEALLLLTFEVARDDPRLFDEVLDWCALNEALISPHRLRTMCSDDVDRRLVASLSAWLSAKAPTGAEAARAGDGTPLLLFPGLSVPSARDPAFAAAGIARLPVERSFKSRAPRLVDLPCVALRLRTVLGAGAISEVATLALTIPAPRIDTQTLARGACFSAKRVRDATGRLADAGLLERSEVAGRLWVHPLRPRWADWLGIPENRIPLDGGWPQLTRACRRLARDLPHVEANADPYLRASDARALWSAVESDLRFAGVPIPAPPAARGAAYWEEFLEAVGAVERFVAGRRSQGSGARAVR